MWHQDKIQLSVFEGVTLHLTGLSDCSMCFILLDCLTALCDSSYWTVSLLYVLHLTGLSLTALCASSYWTVSLLYVLHLTGLSHCSMCFILLDCLTALCASSYWTVSLLYVI